MRPARRRPCARAQCGRGRRPACSLRAEQARGGGQGAGLEGVRCVSTATSCSSCCSAPRSSRIIALQELGTGLVVIGLTVLNAVMGLHQEGKAAESVAALRKMLIMTANVRRDGEQLAECPAEELVPGDIVGVRGRRQGARRRTDHGRGHARDRGGRAHRRERPGREVDRRGRGRRTSRSATASTWPT